MTSKDIVAANLKGEGAPRPGIHFMRGMKTDFQYGGVGNPLGFNQRRWEEGDFEYYDDIWGNIWRRMNARSACRGGEVFKPVLEDWAQLPNFRLPLFDRAKVTATMRASFVKAPDRFPVFELPGWIFAQARYIRRMDNYLLDMALEPDNLHKLHNMLADVYENLILAAGDAGAKAMFFYEDMGTQNGLLFSPTMWDEYFRELYTRLFGLAHSLGISVVMHSCGNNRQILEPLLRAGVNCFQFDQPAIYDFAELDALLRKYHAALWAPVDIQKVLPTGDRRLIEDEAVRMFNTFQGHLIFCTYGDLQGIGVSTLWEQWAYNKILSLCQL